MLALTPLHAVAAGLMPLLRQLVLENKLHPILVNFTAALVPISLLSDAAGRLRANDGLRATGWWTLFFAAAITPLTVATGWLFWMPDDAGATGMQIHKWLGTGFAALLVGLALWRWQFHRRGRAPAPAYLVVALVLVGALMYQGHLGGSQSFGGIGASSESSQSAEDSADPAVGTTAPAGSDRPTRPGGRPAQRIRWRDHIDV